ncbi:hypothetical protein DIPPA_14109 [Diplonema papillatum]|nr:hypothetical protein DIPPA_14109 [Diplonema papillatum]
MTDAARDTKCERAMLEAYATGGGDFDKAWRVWEGHRGPHGVKLPKRRVKRRSTFERSVSQLDLRKKSSGISRVSDGNHSTPPRSRRTSMASTFSDTSEDSSLGDARVSYMMMDDACTSAVLACADNDEQVERVLGNVSVDKATAHSGIFVSPPSDDRQKFFARAISLARSVAAAESLFKRSDGDRRCCRALIDVYAKQQQPIGDVFDHLLALDAQHLERTVHDISALAACCRTDEQLSQVLELAPDETAGILVGAINLVSSQGAAEVLYDAAMAQDDPPLDSSQKLRVNYALLRTYAACQVPIDRALDRFVKMTPVDEGLLGMLLACCASDDAVSRVLSLPNVSANEETCTPPGGFVGDTGEDGAAKGNGSAVTSVAFSDALLRSEQRGGTGGVPAQDGSVAVTSKTLATAVEHHNGTLGKRLYERLNALCEPDEWCCQALIAQHVRCGGGHSEPLDIYKQLLRNGGNPNDWTVGSVLSACTRSHHARQVLECGFNTISSFTDALARGIELAAPRLDRCEMLFDLHLELKHCDSMLSSVALAVCAAFQTETGRSPASMRPTSPDASRSENEDVSSYHCLLSPSLLARVADLLRDKARVSIRFDESSFLMNFPSVGVVAFCHCDGASLCGVALDPARPEAPKRRYYLTDSRKKPIFSFYAKQVLPHAAHYCSPESANWVVGETSGNGRRSQLLHVIKSVVAKSWVRRAGLVWEHAIDYMTAGEMLVLLAALQSGNPRAVREGTPNRVKKVSVVLSPQEISRGAMEYSDSEASTTTSGEKPSPVAFMGRPPPAKRCLKTPFKTPLPLNFDSIPAYGPNTAPSSARVFRTPTTPVDRHSLVAIYNQTVREKSEADPNFTGTITRADAIQSKGIQALLVPIEEYFDCSEALGDRVLTSDDFVGEVLSRCAMRHGSFGASVQIQNFGQAGDLHVGVAPAAAVFAKMERRRLAVTFLSQIVSERDPGICERVQDWLHRTRTAHPSDLALLARQRSQARGLLLVSQDMQTKDDEDKDIRADAHSVQRVPEYTLHPNLDAWYPKEDTVQPLFLRAGKLPILVCSYVQTFETKAEKAEKRRLEKRRMEQDALGLLLPDDWRASGKKHYTLASIKQTIASRRAAKKKQGTIFYKALLQTAAKPVPSDTFKRELTDVIESEDRMSDRPDSSRMDDLSVISNSVENGNDASADLFQYDPNFLDDPEIKSEKKRKLLVIPSLRATVIPYSRGKDLKQDVNQQFMLTHPWIESTRLSLTGIRKAKMIMINLALQDEPHIEASTVAYAVVYFEKLILKQIVTKANRKLVASVCTVLAYKFWESPAVGSGDLSKLLRDLEEHFGVVRKRIMQAEFKIYALLNFDLLVPRKHAEPHFERLLALYNITSQEYLKRKDNSWGLALREEGTAPVVVSANQ